MSGKEPPAPGHQFGPVDLATKPASSLGPTVAQIRIPTVTSGLRPGQPAPRPSGKMVVPVAAPQQGGKVTVLPAPFNTRAPGPGPRPARPILAQPPPGGPRASLSGPILRAVGPGPATHALTLRAPLPQGLGGSIRLASPSVQWVQTSGSGPAGPRPIVTRPPTVLPVGSRVTMAAVSFRPTGPITTVPRPPALVSPTAGNVALLQTGTKTIVTQNPAGIFKPITTQVAASSHMSAMKANPVPVRVPIGQRVSVVAGTPLAVSLTPAPMGHIQVPLVPGSVGQVSGPGGKRVAVAGPGLGKLVAGVPMGVVATQGGPRTISLPYSGQPVKPGLPPSGAIPVARVVPQPAQARQDHPSVPQGYVVSSAPGSAVYLPPSQPGPVNLTVSDRSAFSSRGAPAMTLPSFSQTTLFYDSAPQNSVTITTLPTDTVVAPSNRPAAITPARITPIGPGQQGGGEERVVPGSPRPSILRKRPEGEPPSNIKGTALLQDSPPRPESSGSSTISAVSSEMVDEAAVGSAAAAPSLEPSPRKKPRKQQLPPRETAANVSPEWAALKREVGARDRMEWNRGPEPDWPDKVRNWNSWPQPGPGGAWGEADQADGEADGEVSSEEDQEKPGNFIQGKPRMSLVRSYRHTWKSRANHFLRYTDVRSKDERRPTVNELANQKQVLQKINGWKIFHLGAGLEDIVDIESELSKRLQELGRRLEETASSEVGKELGKVQELIKANIQRSKVIQDQVKEAKDTSQSIFEHKPKIQDIILKYQSKRSLKGRRDN